MPAGHEILVDEGLDVAEEIAVPELFCAIDDGVMLPVHGWLFEYSEDVSELGAVLGIVRLLPVTLLELKEAEEKLEAALSEADDA